MTKCPVINENGNRCNIKSSYNYVGEKPKFCKKHSSENMVDVITKKCKVCGKCANFNYEGEKPPLYCSEHKLENMVNIMNKKKCLGKDGFPCNKFPTFNFEGEKPKYCKEHASDYMIDVVTKKCKVCSKCANFNYENEKIPLYCSEHKLTNMINIVSKRCLGKDGNPCNKVPIFNYSGEKPKYCKEHASSDMINVVTKKCKVCSNCASCNYKGEKNPLYCAKHKLPDMIDIKKKICLEKDCNIKPSYNYEDEKNPLYCKTHALENMIDVITKRCLVCSTCASYNYEGERKPLYCSKHSLPNMINVMSKKCLNSDCNKTPNYNFEGQKEALYCNEHKEEGMINIKVKRCIGINEDGTQCKLIPSYNYEGMKPLYCKSHKLDERMIMVTGKYCIDERCNMVHASFNYPGETKSLYCVKHKLEGMEKVRKKECLENGCKTTPKYNYPNEKSATYCVKHKLEGMIDLYRPTCLECDNFAYYNNKGEKSPIYCNKHKLEGMINLRGDLCLECDNTARYNFNGEKTPIYCGIHKLPKMIDVTKTSCICGKRMSYGFIGCKSIRCWDCKEEGMIINPSKRCNVTKCSEFAIYGYRNNIVCEKHKEDDMINFVEKKCTSCGLFEILTSNNMCYYCDPDKSKDIKKKEHEIKYLLKRNNFQFVSHDKRIDVFNNSDLRVRPDFLFESNNKKFYIVLEVDEFQHQTYPVDCEIKRMFNINQVLMKPTIFIRYNPDEYKTGKTKNPALNVRWKVLDKWLTDLLSKEEIENYSYIQLFYDNYEENKVTLKNYKIST